MIEDTATGPGLEEIERQAAAWAAECGSLAANQFRSGLAVEYKGAGRRDPVTEVDRQIEDFMRERVSARFPGHRILGEERPDLGPDAASYVWVIDPIDGTVNFASGLPIFSTSIGVLKDGVPVVGAMFVSQSTDLRPGVVHARAGGGCYLDNSRLAVFAERTLHPSHAAALPAAFWRRFAFGRGLRWSPVETRTLGSIAYELAMVASGGLQFGAYRAPRIWDVAAGVVLVREAGGTVLRWDEGQQSWVPLQRFEAPKGRRRGEGGRLRDWSLPLLAGGVEVTAFVAQNLRPRGGWRARWWRLLWRVMGG